MKLLFTLPYLASILLSALFALWHRKYLKERYVLILLPFLFYVFTQEAALAIFSKFLRGKPNSIAYNVYRPINVLVFFWIYYRLPFLRPFRKIILLPTVIYLLLILADYTLVESILSPSSYLPLLRGFMITLYALLFLFGYFQLDSASLEKYWRPLLWISIGLIIFYPVISISLAFHKQLLSMNATFLGTRLYNLIPQVMSIFMYSCFCYAFYLCKKTWTSPYQ